MTLAVLVVISLARLDPPAQITLAAVTKKLF
jgi:hypothetical protein